jgi:hypothetical protein
MVEKIGEDGATRYYDVHNVVDSGSTSDRMDDGETYTDVLKKAKSLERDVENMKREKYEERKESFVNDDISEAELEESMDELMESGDDFLNETGTGGAEGSTLFIDVVTSFTSTISAYSIHILALLVIPLVVLFVSVYATMIVNLYLIPIVMIFAAALSQWLLWKHLIG